jgi:hypothetical protein
MRPATGLRLLFGFILLSMIVVTTWASVRQPLWQWGGLTTAPDNAWTIATMFDAYYGLITFFVWLAYMAMSASLLLQLRKLPADVPLAQLLTARNP